MFPVVDGIIKHIIHECHHYQREEFLNKRRSNNWNDTNKRWKHANSWHIEIIKKLDVFVSEFHYLLKVQLFRNVTAEQEWSKN